MSKQQTSVTDLWINHTRFTLQAADVPLLKANATDLDMWESQMKQFLPCAHGVLKFAKKIPGKNVNVFLSFTLLSFLVTIQSWNFIELCYER